jgi:cobalt/nickel transport system ATP-binding protein
MDPKVIVADEPTSDLDPAHARRIELVLVDLKINHRMSVVIATHDMDLAARLADRIYVLAEGNVTRKESKRHLLRQSYLEKGRSGTAAAVRIYENISQDHSLVDAKPVKEHDLIEILSRALEGA